MRALSAVTGYLLLIELGCTIDDNNRIEVDNATIYSNMNRLEIMSSWTVLDEHVYPYTSYSKKVRSSCCIPYIRMYSTTSYTNLASMSYKLCMAHNICAYTVHTFWFLSFFPPDPIIWCKRCMSLTATLISMTYINFITVIYTCSLLSPYNCSTCTNCTSPCTLQ